MSNDKIEDVSMEDIDISNWELEEVNMEYVNYDSSTFWNWEETIDYNTAIRNKPTTSSINPLLLIWM